MKRSVLLAAVLVLACGRAQPRSDSAEPTAAEPTPGDAVATVRSYLGAIKKRAWADALGYWEPGADESVTDSVGFARNHGNTVLNDFEVSTPGPVEGAAGSRYIDVPVVVRSSDSKGTTLELHGLVTLRRAMVDGATQEQRRWRISDIKWRR